MMYQRRLVIASLLLFFLGLSIAGCSSERRVLNRDGQTNTEEEDLFGEEEEEDDDFPFGWAQTPETAAYSCSELKGYGAPSGKYWLYPPDNATGDPIEVYCNQELADGGWALLYNSILKQGTTQFWQIPFADRMKTKGTASTMSNYYNPSLYLAGAEFIDEVVDLAGTAKPIFRATGTEFDPATMVFGETEFQEGWQPAFTHQFKGGWSSTDHDGDVVATNCAQIYAGVSQHYMWCWAYNLGADGGTDSISTDGVLHADEFMGPHMSSEGLQALGLTTDGTQYSRVNRISRWVRW